MPKKSKAVDSPNYDEKYYIISKENTYQLTRHVRRMINAGAKPVGGMIIDESDGGRKYIQTMLFD